MGTTIVQKQRDSKVEILRIIAMIFIVCSHYAAHGCTHALDIISTDFWGGTLLQFLTLGNLGVNLFMAIFGYFNVNKDFFPKRLIPILFEVFFYSIICFTLFAIFDPSVFTLKALIKAIFPISFDEYGFPTIYLVVFVLSPILNAGIKKMAASKRYIVIIAILWTVIPLVTMNAANFYCKELEQYVIAYSIGALIKLHEHETVKITWRYKDILISTLLALLLLQTLLAIVGRNIPQALKVIPFLYERNSPIMLLITWSLISIFTKSNIRISISGGV